MKKVNVCVPGLLACMCLAACTTAQNAEQAGDGAKKNLWCISHGICLLKG